MISTGATPIMAIAIARLQGNTLTNTSDALLRMATGLTISNLVDIRQSANYPVIRNMVNAQNKERQ